jgi:endogenous inhibitor of DNA gyrase (YacG/DUF329 family)
MMNTGKNSKPSTKGPKVDCPACGSSTVYTSGNPFRPFCSERCKVIDLGAWASDQYRVAGSADDAAPDESGNGESAER